MESIDDQEERASNPFRGCQIGACFACGLGSGKGKGIPWQSSRPNPLPTFPWADEFYTPILLPGMYLPLEFMSSQLDDGNPFYTTNDPELAKYVVAFLAHENSHRHLLAGIVPMVMRLLASRCYLQLALLTKQFRPSRWEDILLQSKNIEDLYWAIAPLHEVVANLRNLVLRQDNPYALHIGKESLTEYKKAYGKGFENVLNDFSYIIENLEEWFAPSPIEPFIIYTLAEYMFMGAIDEQEVRTDLFTSPPLIPKRRLFPHLAQVGMPYFVQDKQPPTYSWYPFTYTVYDIAGRLEEIKSGIQKAKLPRSKKTLETDLEQLMYIAKAIPKFYKWLQRRDKIAWLKRRVFDRISEVQDMIKENRGFDLPLMEAWQSDISPNIIILIPDESTGECEIFNYGRRDSFENMYERFDEQHRQKVKEAYASAGALIGYGLQSERTIGIWYGPSVEKVNRTPITPAVRFVSQLSSGDGGVPPLVTNMGQLAIFESLRVQIASGEGISCIFHHQNGGRCCGNEGLVWSIYEAGLKAIDIKELDWSPKKWAAPECSRQTNS